MPLSSEALPHGGCGIYTAGRRRVPCPAVCYLSATAGQGFRRYCSIAAYLRDVDFPPMPFAWTIVMTGNEAGKSTSQKMCCRTDIEPSGLSWH